MIKVYFDDVLIDTDSYTQLDNEYKLFTESFKLGSTASNVFYLSVDKSAVSSQPSEVRIEDDITTWDFIVDNITANDNVYTYVLVEKLMDFNFEYDASVLINAKADNEEDCYLSDIWHDMCDKAGVEYDETYVFENDIVVNWYDNRVQARRYLSFIAELQSGYACMLDNGKQSFKKQKRLSVKTIDADECSDLIIGEKKTITRVVYDGGAFKWEFGDEIANTIEESKINPAQDYDMIQTLTFAEASGTCNIRLYRGSTSAYSGTVKIREGTSGAWSDLSVSGTTTTFNVTNTTMQIAHDWNKSGNTYMTCSFYGQSTNLTSIAISQKAILSGVIGNLFMYNYARDCASLTSLDVPDTSGITSVGGNFMTQYAQSCTNLTSLDVPDTSSITTVGNNFMYSYAFGCNKLTSLGIPDTSVITTVGVDFMTNYALGCNALTTLILPSVGWFATHDVNWGVPSGRLSYLKGNVLNSADLSGWQALTTSTSPNTLYLNYIRSDEDVISLSQDDTGDTLYLQSDNVFIVNEQIVENIYNNIKDFEFYIINCPQAPMDSNIRAGDIITFDDNGTLYPTIAQYKMSYAGGWTGGYQLQVNTERQQETQVTRTAENVKNLKVDVDRLNNEFSIVVEQIDENSSQITTMEQTVDGITTKIEEIDGIKEDVAEISAQIDGLEVNVVSSGGTNLIQNSVGYFTGDWDTENESYTDTDIKNNTISKNAWLLQNLTSEQIIQVQNGTYTLSGKYKKLITLADCKISINGYETELTEEVWSTFTYTFEVLSNTITIDLISDTDDSCYVTDLMLNVGSLPQIWTPANGESIKGNVKIGNVIIVSSDTSNTRTIMDTDGNRIENASTGEVIAEYTDKGMNTKEIEAESGTIANLLIMDVGDQTWLSRL